MKIAITGPESTGKTILSEQLTKHYEAELVVEFARTHLTKIGKNYKYRDVLFMAEQQIKLEMKAELSNNKIIICDTDAINFKIWMEFYNFKIPQFLLEYIQSKPYAHSLLLYPNINWVSDGLRKNERNRIFLFNRFEQNLNAYQYSYTTITGVNDNRFKEAIKIIDQLL